MYVAPVLASTCCGSSRLTGVDALASTRAPTTPCGPAAHTLPHARTTTRAPADVRSNEHLQLRCSHLWQRDLPGLCPCPRAAVQQHMHLKAVASYSLRHAERVVCKRATRAARRSVQLARGHVSPSRLPRDSHAHPCAAWAALASVCVVLCSCAATSAPVALAAALRDGDRQLLEPSGAAGE
jgi:hypothetical protein